MLRVARRSAVRARTQASNQMTALIGSADESLRAELRPLPAHTRIHTCAAFAALTEPDEPIGATRHALGVLARRWLQLNIEITALDDQLAQVVPVAAPTLLDVYGVGIDTASSGKITRHRLNRGGNREANSALWRVAMVRLSEHQPTRDYAAKRTAQGRTKPEIIRILKRYIAREVYPHLRDLPR